MGLLTKGPAAPRERPVPQGERGGTAVIRHWASLQAGAKQTETGSQLLPLWKGRRYKQMGFMLSARGKEGYRVH